MDKINLIEKFSQIDKSWDPKIIGELNNQHVKLVKFKDEFDWHKHEQEDELFLVIKGSFEMQYRDRTIHIKENELVIVPRGTEHCPKANEDVCVLLFEPVSTLNTGNIKSDKTVLNPDRI